MSPFNRKATTVAKPARRLALEILEERAVPAIEVTTLLDNTNSTLPLSGSLRDAIYFGSTVSDNTVIFNDYLFTKSVGTIHSPTALAVGKYDSGSGRGVVTVSNVDPSYAVASNPMGNGILIGASSLRQTTASATAIESADLNRDGIDDLITLEGGFIRTYLGSASGTFTAGQSVSLPSSSGAGLVVADLNNDGQVDVATATNGGIGGKAGLLYAPGNGAGGFGSPVTLALSNANITGVSTGDANGDGLADLIATSSDGAVETVLRDKSNPSSYLATTVSSAVKAALSNISLARLDSGAFADAVVVDRVAGAITILSGIGDGSFATKSTISLPAGSLPGQPRLADIDNDGKVDMVLPVTGLNKVFYYAGIGDGTFRANPTTVDVLAPSDIRIADMTGDGAPDIIASSSSSNSFAVFRIGDFRRLRTVDTTNAPVSLAVGSFDGVPGADVINATGLYNFNVPITNGSFTANPGVSGLPITTPLDVAASIPTIPNDPSRAINHLEPADLNGDGKSDFVGLNRATGTIQSAIGIGDGTFTAGAPVALGAAATGLVAADLNLDGNPDVAAVTTGAAGRIFVVPGSNTGAFIPLGTKSYASGLDNLVALAAADVTGDSRADLIAINSAGSLVTLTRDALGTGFNTPGIITAGTGTATGFAVADINGDKVADAVVADTANNLLRVYLGVSGGSFTAAGTVPFLPGSAPASVRLGDVTGDGKADIVAALPGIGQIAVVQGNGNGTFAASYRSLEAEAVSDIRLADMTGDGKPDIVAALANTHSFAIFQQAKAVTINPVATQQGVLVLNGSVGRLQFNNNTNLNIAGPGKFTEGAFANQYKLVIQSDLGIKQAKVTVGGTGYRIGDTLAQTKGDRTGGAVFTVVSINDAIDGSIDGLGAIASVGVLNPGSNAGFLFDPAGNKLTSPVLLSQANSPGLTQLTAFGPSIGAGAVLSVDPANIGLASGLAHVQMQTTGKNTLSFAGVEFGAGFQNIIFQGLGSLKLDDVRFNNFDKFGAKNTSTNYVFVQAGAGNLSISNSTIVNAPAQAITMAGAESLSISESLFQNGTKLAIDYTGPSATITGSSFVANNAGAVQVTGGLTTVTNSLFKDNVLTDKFESALTLLSTTATVTSSVFEDNSGINNFTQTLGDNAGGAAILAIGSPLTIRSSLFTGNSLENVKTMNSGGGAVYNFNSPLTIDQCGFENNRISITDYPDSVPAGPSVSFFNLNPDFQPSPRYSGGGAVYSGGPTTITNSYFNLNTVDSQVDYWQLSPAEGSNPTEPQYTGGGGLYLTRNLGGNTTNTINNVTFTQNTAIQTANRADATRSANSVSKFATTFAPRSLVIGNKFRSGTVGTASDVVTSYLNGIEVQQNKGGTSGFNPTNVPTGTLGTFLTKGYLNDNLAALQFEDLILGDFSALTFLQSDGKTPVGFTKFLGAYPTLVLGAQPAGAALADMFQLKYNANVFRNDLLVATRAQGATPAQVRAFTLDELATTTLTYNPSFAPVNLSFDPIDIQLSRVTETVSAVGEKQFTAFVTGFDSSLNRGVLQRFTITQVYQNVTNSIPTAISGTITASAPRYFTGSPLAMAVGNIDNSDGRDDVAISTNNSILVFDGPTLFQQASLNLGGSFSPILGPDIGDITLADVNGDNLPELLATFGINSKIGVFYNTGNFDFSNQTPQIFACSPFPVAVDAGDMAGKGTQIVVATAFNNFDIINPTGSVTSTGRGLNGGAMIIADGRAIGPSTYLDNYPFLVGASDTTLTNVTVSGNSLVNQFATVVNRGPTGATNTNIADTGGIFVDASGLSSSVRLMNTLNLGNTGIEYIVNKGTTTAANTFVNTSRSFGGATFSSLATNMFNPATSPGYKGGYAGDVIQSDLQASTDPIRLRTEDVSSVIGLIDLLGGGNALQFQGRVKTVAIDRLSPARDAGTDVSATIPTDARGLNRKIGYAVDIGAYEVQIGTKTAVQSPLLRPADSTHPNVYFSIVYGQKTAISINTLAFDNVPLVDAITGRIDLVRASDQAVIGTASLVAVDALDKSKGANATIVLNPAFDQLLPVDPVTGKLTVFARYPGDSNNAVSQTTPFDIFVTQAPVTLSLNPVAPSLQAGSSITLSGAIDTANSIAPLLGSVKISLAAPGAITTIYNVPIQYDSNDPSKGTFSQDVIPPALNSLGNYTITVTYNDGGNPEKFALDPMAAPVTASFEVVKTPTVILQTPLVPVVRGTPLILFVTVVPPVTSGVNDPTPLSGTVDFLRSDGSIFATATLPGTPSFGAVTYSVTITNTTDPIYSLPDAPNNTIVARYNRGSGFYSTASSVAQFLNLVGQPTTTTMAPTGSLGTQSYGTANTFVVDLTGLPSSGAPNQPISGSQVQLVANGGTVVAAQNFVNGTSRYTFSNVVLAPGTYGISARYTGDGLNFNASVSPVATLTVNQAATTLTLLPAMGSSLRLVAGPNASTTLVATVSAPAGTQGVAPTGSILFLASGIAVGAPVPVVAGTASLTRSFPAAGSSDITAQFIPGNSLYTSASATATVTASQLSLMAVTPTVVRGDTVSLKALETPILSSATIEFIVLRANQVFVIGTHTSTSSSLDPLRPGTIYNGSFRSDIPNSTLALGANQVYARYGSEPDRLKWAGPITITVSPQGTTTALSVVPPTSPRYGDPVSIGATVISDSQQTLASPQSGTVSVVDTLSGSTINSVTAAVHQLPQQNVFLNAGTYQFQAAYSGDNANFTGSKSTTFPLTVGKAVTTLSVNASSASPVNLGSIVVLTATVSANLVGSAGGTVQFFDNGVAIGAPRPLQVGVATINHLPSRIGSHVFTAVYSGDGNFESASGGASGTTVVTGRAPFFAVASGTGSGIQVFDAATRAPITTLFPETTNYKAGFRVATGDVTGDGVVDVVYSTTLGSTVGVIDGQSLTVLPGRRFSAFSPNYTRPVNLAISDVDGDGIGDIAVAPASTGTSPLVRAFSGANGSLLFSRLAYASNFTGGVSIAAGDLTGDGRAELICAPLSGNAARVVAFDVSTGIQVRNFTVAGAGSTNGFSIAAADLNNDKRADIVLGALAGSSKVTVVDGQSRRTLGSFSAFGNATTGARVAAIADFNNDGIADILVGAGANGNGQVRRYSGATRQLIDTLFAFQAGGKERSTGVYLG